MSLESIRLYVNLKPQPREGQAFATRYGWAVPNRFDNKKFSVSYELHGLDAVLFTNGAGEDGGFPRASLAGWAEVVEKYGEQYFSQVVVDAVKGYAPEEPVYVAPFVATEPTGTEQAPALEVMPEDMVHGDLPLDTETTPPPPAGAYVAADVTNEPSPPFEEPEVGDTVEPVAQPVVEPAVTYTLEQLTAMEMDELRALADPYGVKSTSKAKLAAKLLAAMQKAE